MRGKMEYDFRNVVTDGKCENKRLPNPRKPLAHDNRMFAERAFYCILTF